MTAAAVINSLFENDIFVSTIISWGVAQFLKMIIKLMGRKYKSPKEAIETVLWSTGGMPSSHSAVVCSLTTAVCIKEFPMEGVSDLFVLCVIFSFVVLRDALGVRRATGLLAKALNTLGKSTADKIGIDFHVVKEIQGHTPLEVLVGAFLGIFIATGYILL